MCSPFLFGYVMATLAETLKSVLLADATLTALLPGGVVDAEDLPYDGGGVRSVPRLPDGVVAATFALIRWRSSNATGPSAVQGELAFLEIYAYQDTGYAEVEAAMTRMKSLLNRREFVTDDRAVAYLEFVGVFGETDVKAEEFGGLSFKFIRFSVTQIRR